MTRIDLTPETAKQVQNVLRSGRTVHHAEIVNTTAKGFYVVFGFRDTQTDEFVPATFAKPARTYTTEKGAQRAIAGWLAADKS